MVAEADNRNSTEPAVCTVRISIADMAALRVRTAEAGNPPPKLLYQLLPGDAMPLIASIPSENFAVSIPQHDGRYPILRAIPPESKEGPIIVYTREPNGRYEAAEVLQNGKPISVAHFVDNARRWAGETPGRVMPITGKYAYFAPTRDQWEVILRDGGYAVPNPRFVAFEITPETLQARMGPSASGIIARLPLFSPPAVFARVEVTIDPHPGQDSSWLGFKAFQRVRSLQSRPPETVTRLFQEWVNRFAAESGFKSWSFKEGMLFGDHTEWWGDRCRRRTTHEGVDFVEGILSDGAIREIPEGTPVRALSDGAAVAILDDFLNKTLVVRHAGIRGPKGEVFHTFYSHIRPEKDSPGPIRAGHILGTVAKSKSAGAPAHMHCTAAWIPDSLPAGEITMDKIAAAFAPIVLVNFNGMLRPPVRSLSPD